MKLVKKAEILKGRKYMLKTKLSLFIFLSFLLIGCSSKGEPVKEEAKDEEETLTVKDYEEYLSSNEYIEEYFETSHPRDKEFIILGIKMKEDFYALDLTEQYLYLTKFISERNTRFEKVISEELDTGFLVYIFKGDNDLPTYTLGNGGFTIESINLEVHFVMSQSDKHNFNAVSDYLIKLNKDEVLNGTIAGLTKEQYVNNVTPLINKTTIEKSGEITTHKYTGYESLGEISGELAKEAEDPKKDNIIPDSETYLNDMTGNDWVLLSDNQKFHGVSNALYNLESNGFKILETEQFFIDALDEFYTDTTTMSTNAIDALASIGKMSETMTK